MVADWSSTRRNDRYGTDAGSAACRKVPRIATARRIRGRTETIPGIDWQPEKQHN